MIDFTTHYFSLIQQKQVPLLGLCIVTVRHYLVGNKSANAEPQVLFITYVSLVSLVL